QRIHEERVIGPFGVGDVHLGRQPDHGDRGSLAEEIDVVVPASAVDDDRVGRSVAAACGGAEVHVNLSHGRSGQVVDGEGVGAAQGVDVDSLHVVEVHRDVANVAEQSGPRSVGGE